MTEYGLVAIKRDWCPNWLWTILANVGHFFKIEVMCIQPMRWIFTTEITNSRHEAAAASLWDCRKQSDNSRYL